MTVLHDDAMVRANFPQTLLLARELVAWGPTAQVLTEPHLARARAMGIDPWAALSNNDGHGFFESLGDQVITGPTLTNVNDFRAVFIA